MANIKVNADVWADTTEDDRQAIKAVLVASKLLKIDDDIEGDPNTPAVYSDDEASESDDAGSVRMMAAASPCKAACKAMRDAARAACGVKYPFSSKKRRKCREAVERAYQGCVALCDESDG